MRGTGIIDSTGRVRRQATRVWLAAGLLAFLLPVVAPTPAAATGGVVSYFTAPSISDPTAIVAGPGRALLFANGALSAVGRITTSGVVSSYYRTRIGFLPSIAAGSDGALWFVDHYNSSIGRITTAGVITYYGAGINAPIEIAAGPDGALWFVTNGYNFIGRITTAGVVTSYRTPPTSRQGTSQPARTVPCGSSGGPMSSDGSPQRFVPALDPRLHRQCGG